MEQWGGGNYSPTLADNTWAQIGEAVASNDPILDSWEVGDEKDAVVNGETLTFVIVGKNHDDLADGSGKAKLTFGMKNLMASGKQMNVTNTSVGLYPASSMYSWLAGTVYQGLDSELKNSIKAVRKHCSTIVSGGMDTEVYVWLFSEMEVTGELQNSYSGEGSKYEYFATTSERIKRLNNGSGNLSNWWLRSTCRGDTTVFCIINNAGISSDENASDSLGVCFGFCI